MLLKISFLILSTFLFSSCKTSVEDQPIQYVHIADTANKVCTLKQVVADTSSKWGYKFVQIANEPLEKCNGVIGVDAETFKSGQVFYRDNCN